MYCIYRTTNLINGKTYVGQHRFENVNDSYLGSGTLIRQAVTKYGIRSFKKEIIIFGDFTQEQIDKFERCMIFFERLNSKAEYNIANGGNGVGKHSDETRRKISESKTGKKVIFSDEHKRRLSEALKGNKPSEASKEKNRQAHLGKKLGPHSESTKRKISESHKGDKNPMFGKHLSDETKRKLSDKLKGENNPMFGKPFSEEHKRKLSENNFIKKISKEYKIYRQNGGQLKWHEFLREYKNSQINDC